MDNTQNKKTCSKCKITKKTTAFNSCTKNSIKKLRADCKECQRLYNKNRNLMMKQGPSTKSVINMLANNIRESENPEQIDNMIARLNKYNEIYKVEKASTDRNSFVINRGSSISRNYERDIDADPSNKNHELIFRCNITKIVSICTGIPLNSNTDIQLAIRDANYLVCINEIELSDEQKNDILTKCV